MQSRPWRFIYSHRVWLVLLLSLVLVLGLAGCWSSGDSEPEETEQPAEAAHDTDTESVVAEEIPPEVGEPLMRPTLAHLGPELHTERVRDLGRATFHAPDPEDLLTLGDDYYAPANHVWVLLEAGEDRSTAEGLAAAWNATIVGEIELLAAYQLETTDTVLSELRTRLEAAEDHEDVRLALPNLLVSIDSRITVERCNPVSNQNYEDPFHYVNRERYGVERARLTQPYEMIGLQDAWTMIAMADVALHRVSVGVFDTSIWGDTPEMNVEGGPRILGMRESDLTAAPTGPRLERVSHGTTVSHTIAADHRVGRSVGVASVLGDRLSLIGRTISSQEFTLVEEESEEDDGEEGAEEEEEQDSDVPPEQDDADDPEEEEPDFFLLDWNEHVWVMEYLVDLKELIESGASIINISMGPLRPPANPTEDDLALGEAIHDAFTAFAAWTLENHPDVLLVAAAGNDNLPLTKIGEWFGQRQPNVMTIGGLNFRAERAYFSNFLPDAEDGDAEWEISLAAPAMGIIAHHDAAGRNVTELGNSFSAPQVAGAAAILRSLKPDLTAGQIKEILVGTALSEIRIPDVDDDPLTIASSVGGRILRVDRAVLHVINLLRREQGLPAISAEELLGLREFVVRASGGPETYQIEAEHSGTAEGSLNLGLYVLCENATAPAHPWQQLEKGEVADWTITRREDAGFSPMIVMILCEETDLCYIVTMSPPKSAWDVTACTRGEFSISGGFIGTRYRLVFGNPEEAYFDEKDPEPITATGFRVSPGRGHVEFASLEWQGLYFEAADTREQVLDERAARTGISSYPVDRWVRGKVSPEMDRVVWIEAGERHNARWTRPGTDLEPWTSDAYISEWMWAAQDIPIERIEHMQAYMGPRLPEVSLEEQGLVSAFYRAQQLSRYRPSIMEEERGRSTWYVTDDIMRWPGDEATERSTLTIRFELPEDYWDTP